jgi:predicted outer membrane repeat protein
LVIDQDLTLTGAGADSTIIRAATQPGVADFRIFNIAGGNVAISGVTIRYGNPSGDGGGIYNQGILTLKDSTVSSNVSVGSSGGGIYSSGTLTLANSTLSGNTSGTEGGGIYNVGGTLTLTSSTLSGNTSGWEGGGIYNVGGTLTLANSTISGNTAGTYGGGIYNYSGTLTLSSSTVRDNATSDLDNGGGIYNLVGTLILTNSTVNGNTSGVGGGIYNQGSILTLTSLTDSTVSGNTATTVGGGIYHNSGALTLTSSTVSNNTFVIGFGGQGGGIYSLDSLTMNNSTVSGNTAYDGGGISNVGTMALTSSTVSNNIAYFGNGGGIDNSGGTLTLTSSTISGNQASSNGGGIYNDSGTLTLTSSTISNNAASVKGGGIRNLGTADLANTITADNAAPNGPDCNGNITSQGYNLLGDTSGCIFASTTGDLVGVDPLLSPLQDNGGPTFTQALLPGSPAIDAGNPAPPGSSDTACPATDQRGVARPQGAACDIGAFEVDGLPPGNNLPVALDDAYSVEEDRTLAVAAPGVLANDTDADGDTLTSMLVSGPTYGVLALNADGSFSYTPNPGFEGNDSFTYVANDGALDSNPATVSITVMAASPPCTLTVELGYASDTLTMSFEIGTLEPATWNVWLSYQNRMITIRSSPIPVVDPPVTGSLTITRPNLGTVGVLTTLTTAEGIICSEWETINTGPATTSVETMVEKLRELFLDVH